MATGDHVVGALDHHQRRPGQLGQPVRARRELAGVLGAVDEQHRAAHRPAGLLDLLEVEREWRRVARIVGQEIEGILALLESEAGATRKQAAIVQKIVDRLRSGIAKRETGV